MFTYGVDADRPSIHFAWPGPGTCAMSRVRVYIPSSLCDAGSEGPVAHLPSPPPPPPSASALEAATAALHGRHAHDILAHHATSSRQHPARPVRATRPRDVPDRQPTPRAYWRRSTDAPTGRRIAPAQLRLELRDPGGLFGGDVPQLGARVAGVRCTGRARRHAGNASSEVLHAACERATHGRPLSTATRADGQPARHGRASCTKRRTQQAQASFSWPPLYWRRRTQA